MKTRSSRVNNAHETRLKHVEYEGNTRLKHVEYAFKTRGIQVYNAPFKTKFLSAVLNGIKIQNDDFLYFVNFKAKFYFKIIKRF
jgi:hypothetical protein